MGNPECRCGVQDSALQFDGIDDYLDFPLSINSVFQGPFTVSFYFWVQNGGSDPVDLVSFMKACDRDSMFNISFVPVTNQVIVEVSQQSGISINLRGDLNPGQCWHFVSFTSNGEDFHLYLDGELAERKSRSGAIEFSESGRFFVSNSPCIGVLNTQRLRGVIDELNIYSQELVLSDVSSLFIKPDQILNRDTTVFFGDAVQIRTGGTCANSFSWSPTDGLNVTDQLEPIITPDQSTVYTLQIDHGVCVARDTIDIKVIDPGSLTCDNLLMPTAFTPNGDNINDLYTISNSFIIENLLSFEIFDRWGGTVYSSTDKLSGWNGNFKGNTVNPGTFLWKVNYTCGGNEFFKTGSFTLIR